jgi:DNA ligase-1
MPALVEGSPVYIKGSGAKPYELKNVGGVYSCSCPAWRNQSNPIDKRTCKHLKSHCGDAAETARIGGVSIQPALGTAPTSATVCNTTKVPLMEVIAEVTDQKEKQRQEIMARAAAEGRKLRQDEKAKLNGPPVLLAYQDVNAWMDIDPTGWWESEKLDGVRCYWDPSRKEFITRQGNVYRAPEWFLDGLPDHNLDGELWIGRRRFQEALAVVRRHDGGDLWKKVTYRTYDLPHLLDVEFEERMARLEAAVRSSTNKFLHFHPQHQVESKAQLEAKLKKVVAEGAEGLMLRKPRSLYEIGRSATLLKMKMFYDAEATVIGHTPGKGKFKGMLGALSVRMPDGKEFEVGTGLSNDVRRNPPKVGAEITYRYMDKTDAGIPKGASFVCVRDYE